MRGFALRSPKAFAAIKGLVDRDDAYYSHGFGVLIKGSPEIIVENGNLIVRTMRRNHISRHDLEEDMRLGVKTKDLSKIKVARAERSGDISFIKAGT